MPVGGGALRAEAGGVGAVELEHPLKKHQQLGVDPLQLGRFRGEDVDPDVVANRHLIEGAAEVGMHDREALEAAVPLLSQIEILPSGLGGGGAAFFSSFFHPDPFGRGRRGGSWFRPRGKRRGAVGVPSDGDHVGKVLLGLDVVGPAFGCDFFNLLLVSASTFCWRRLVVGDFVNHSVMRCWRPPCRRSRRFPWPCLWRRLFRLCPWLRSPPRRSEGSPSSRSPPVCGGPRSGPSCLRRHRCGRRRSRAPRRSGGRRRSRPRRPWPAPLLLCGGRLSGRRARLLAAAK